MNAKRKPLDQRFEAFVRGDETSEDKPIVELEPTSTDPEPSLKPEPSGKKKQVKESSSLLDKLTVGAPDDLKPITLNLPLSMHRKLKELSGKTGRNKSEIIRFALESLFQELGD